MPSSAEPRPNALVFMAGLAVLVFGLVVGFVVTLIVLLSAASPEAGERGEFPIFGAIAVLGFAAVLCIAIFAAGISLVAYGLSGRWPERRALWRWTAVVAVAGACFGLTPFIAR